MERIILGITDLGLGTCWVGGTFRRNDYAYMIDLAADELLPAITPVGYPPRDSRTIVDKSLVYLAQSRNRKPWEKLFFLHDFAMPLTENEAGDYREMIRAVQLAPSASNKQPWRIVKERDRNNYHFYLAENRGYIGNRGGKVKMQKIDMALPCAILKPSLSSGGARMVVGYLMSFP